MRGSPPATSAGTVQQRAGKAGLGLHAFGAWSLAGIVHGGLALTQVRASRHRKRIGQPGHQPGRGGGHNQTAHRDSQSDRSSEGNDHLVKNGTQRQRDH